MPNEEGEAAGEARHEEDGAEEDGGEKALGAEERANGEAGSGGKIALQALIAEGVKAVLEEMRLSAAEFTRAQGAGKPRCGGATGGANPPPRAEEDDFMKGFREV